MKNLIILGVVLWVCSGSVTAQSSNLEELCASIKEKVVIAQNPLEVFRKRVFSKDCVFVFSVRESSRISVYLERYDSADEASTELDSQKEGFIGFDRLHYEDRKTRDRYKNIDPDGFWNKAVAYKNTAKPDHFAILRRDKYLILILARDFSVLKKTQRLLRDIRFD